ncbi:hypothetical protein [Pseudomonas sp. AU10]|uniref:hypothetical protein n=1 Tax=Pseudomonas sp. AU10 TaxID=882697 RepID=UPI0021E246EB|nr:hypothetical protein [Pseudomonas sp. AU10]MCV2231135.1 hypothetical protein [Pseudomonas sp. AU10]
MKNTEDDDPATEQIKKQNGGIGPLTTEEIQSLREEMQRDGKLMKQELERRGKKKWSGHA